MKKIVLILITIVCCLLSQAQTYIWKDGKIVYSASAAEIRFNKIPARNFQTVANVAELNNYLYHLCGEQNSYRTRLAGGWHGYNTDIERHTGNYEYSLYTITTTCADLSAANKDPWTYLSKMVYDASIIIEGIEKYCDTTKAAYAYLLGEALFLRAFALSEMVKLWGDVPMTWKFAFGSIVPAQAKQDRNLAYEAVRADLKRAADLLPWSDLVPEVRVLDTYREPTSGNSVQESYMEHQPGRNYTGRPSKAAALALLARVDLNYAGFALRPNTLGTPADGYGIQLNLYDANKRRALYQEALEACAQIIKREDYKLLTDYAQIFKKVCADVTDYQQSEVIWEIPFADGVRGQVMNRNASCNKSALGVLKNTTSSSKAQSRLTIVPTLFFDFEQGDKRRDVTLSRFQWNYDSSHKIAEVSGSCLYQKVQRIDKWYLGKWRLEWMSRATSSDDDGVNFPIIRYADVMLMFCEAALGGITGDVPDNTTGVTAQSQFDKIRARAGVASKQLNMNNLMAERKLEFAGEYLRKYDLIRWGKLRSAMEAARVRLQNLSAHSGEFADIPETVYYKFRENYDYTVDGSKCYVLDAFLFEQPADYYDDNGWQKTNIFESDAQKVLDESSYFLYDYEHPENLDSHQLWPIFTTDMQYDEKGYLWNDYDY